MRILFVGQMFSGSTGVQRARAMRELGHEVTVVDLTPADPKREYTFFNRVINRLGFPPDLAKANDAMARAARGGRFDLLWVEKGRTITPDTLHAFRAAQPAARMVWYSNDDVKNRGNQSRAFFAAFPLYDVHVTTNRWNVPELAEMGARRVIFTEFAFDLHDHSPPELTPAERERFRADAGFVGQWERDRFEQMMALAEAGVAVTVHGPSWEPYRNAHPNLRLGESWLGPAEYRAAVAATRVNLGFLRKANRDVSTQRTFEIPAIGGFLLAERTDVHRSLFDEGREADFFGDTAELVAKTKHWLANEEMRRHVAAAGRERCLRDGYSYHDRLAVVFREIDGAPVAHGAGRAA